MAEKPQNTPPPAEAAKSPVPSVRAPRSPSNSNVDRFTDLRVPSRQASESSTGKLSLLNRRRTTSAVEPKSPPRLPEETKPTDAGAEPTAPPATTPPATKPARSIHRPAADSSQLKVAAAAAAAAPKEKPSLSLLNRRRSSLVEPATAKPEENSRSRRKTLDIAEATEEKVRLHSRGSHSA
jgi:hypothetical protein